MRAGMAPWGRNVALLLGLFALLIGAAWLTTSPAGPPLPAGSSRSYAPDGTQALFLWTQALGWRADRYDGRASPPAAVAAGGDAPGALLVVEPAVPLREEARGRLDAVAARGGTLVLAGDSAIAATYLAPAGITIEPTRIYDSATVATSGAALPAGSRSRLRGDGVTPLLLNPAGEPIAVRKPYLQGTIIAFATRRALTNEALRDPGIARFVYREVLGTIPAGAAVRFDESVYVVPTSEPAADAEQAGLGGLLAGTAPGRAALYAAGVVFVYLLLSGRRLGPALPPVAAAEASRPMYEHVQALAGLYRRAGQLAAVREHFVRQYERLAAQPGSAELRHALDQVKAARSEADLLAAVARAETAARPGLTLRGVRGTR